MILKSSHFDGLFEKIAQNVTSITTRSSIKNKSSISNKNSSSSGNAYGSGSRNSNSLNNTLPKAMKNHDTQPLNKDTNKVDIPRDSTVSKNFSKRQDTLSRMNDRRRPFNVHSGSSRIANVSSYKAPRLM